MILKFEEIERRDVLKERKIFGGVEEKKKSDEEEQQNFFLP